MLRLARKCTIGLIRCGGKANFLSGNIQNRFVTTYKVSGYGKETIIPLVDLGNLGINSDPDPNDKDWERVAKEISDAFKDIGFVYVTGHGVPQEQIDRITKAGSMFFDLPEEKKLKYVRNVDKLHGYLPINSEKGVPTSTLELRESYDIRNSEFFFPDDEVPDFRKASADFLQSCIKLANRILVVMGLGLGIPPSTFLDGHRLIGQEGNRTIGRVIHYPPVPDDAVEGTIRIGKHSDFDTLTLLFQDDMGGLQILDNNGNWADAVPVPGTALINVGDFIQMWTSGKFKATEHRVIVPEDEVRKQASRRSLACFIAPDSAQIIKPLDGSDAFEPFTAEDYIYKKLGEFYQPSAEGRGGKGKEGEGMGRRN